MRGTMDSFNHQLGRGFGDFRVVAPDKQEKTQRMCSYAQQFWPVAEKICLDALRNSSHTAINKGKSLLLERFFGWWWMMPKDPCHQLGENEHICLFQIFERAYRQLKTAEESLTDWPMV